jgi:hypothetical protein
MKFSIRDLLWLTLLAAVAVAWWVDRSRLAERMELLEGIGRFRTSTGDYSGMVDL